MSTANTGRLKNLFRLYTLIEIEKRRMVRLNFLPIFVLFVLSLTGVKGQDADGIYNIGVGIGDITGPPAGVVLNGYVNPITYAAGIYTRQFARAFVIESKTDGKVISYVTCDMGMMDHSIKTEAIKKLELKYPGKFSEKNVMISATHTHSGVSGFMTYYAYLVIESYGFNPLTFWAAVDGIVESISKSMESMQSGRLYWNSGDLLGANRNRASTSYQANLDKHLYEYSVDKEMIILKMESLNETPIGIFTWWPVHPISFNGGINPLVSSDSKGYAAILFDQRMEPNSRPGRQTFVSGFGSSNLGDVSPNHSGNENIRLDFSKDINDTRILGTFQFQKAFELFNDKTSLNQIKGRVAFVHSFVDTTKVSVDVEDPISGTKEILSLCLPALGFSYVGLEPSPLWEAIRDLLIPPSDITKKCHEPKEVALAAGEFTGPWAWTPTTIALQILTVGEFDMVGLPGEFTTMAGRRVRNAVYNVTGHKVVLAGLANEYINYITTPEEYDVQESAGGATIYGRNTVPIMATLFARMANATTQGVEDQYPTDEPPPSFLNNVRPEIDVRLDRPTEDGPFGTVVLQPWTDYEAGDEIVTLFASASPRHSPLRGGTFMLVEKQNEQGGWDIVRTDADLDTTFWWNPLFNRGEIKWKIPETYINFGSHRIRHFGYWLTDNVIEPMPYTGTTNTFQIRSRSSVL